MTRSNTMDKLPMSASMRVLKPTEEARMQEYRGYSIFEHYGEAKTKHWHYQYVPEGGKALIDGDCRGAKSGFPTIKAAKADIDALVDGS